MRRVLSPFFGRNRRNPDAKRAPLLARNGENSEDYARFITQLRVNVSYGSPKETGSNGDIPDEKVRMLRNVENVTEW